MYGFIKALILIAFAILTGCGYGLVKRDVSRNQTIAIPLFGNKTFRPNLESCVTERLVDLFARSCGGRVVSPANADLELTGNILDYSESVSGYNASDKVAVYRVMMTVEASLRERKSGSVLWKGVLRAGQDYPTSSDLAFKLNAEDAARRELCRKLAEDIGRESGNSF